MNTWSCPIIFKNLLTKGKKWLRAFTLKKQRRSKGAELLLLKERLLIFENR